ncbi:MAG: hypothetical protein B7Z26_08365, partial [Asticcacaulis sp. 32-58-5]
MARLWIRTEASAAIGLGHFMRCFAIAEAARAKDWKVSFILNDASEAAQSHMAAIGANWVLFGGAVALLPIFAQDILKVGPEGFGFLRAAP